MKARLPVVALLLTAVAAAAFQAGRASVPAPAPPDHQTVAAARGDNVSAPATAPAAALDQMISQIATISARDAYLTLKAASP